MAPAKAPAMTNPAAAPAARVFWLPDNHFRTRDGFFDHRHGFDDDDLVGRRIAEVGGGGLVGSSPLSAAVVSSGAASLTAPESGR